MRIGPTPRPWNCLAASWTDSDPSGAAFVTFRPEFKRPGSDGLTSPHSPSIGWGSATSSAMIDRVVGNKPLPAKHSAGHHRAYRWHSPVRRGDDQGGAGSGERRRGRTRARPFRPAAGSPCKLARIADGAARPAWSRQEVAQIGAAIGREFSHALIGCGGA